MEEDNKDSQPRKKIEREWETNKEERLWCRNVCGKEVEGTYFCSLMGEC